MYIYTHKPHTYLDTHIYIYLYRVLLTNLPFRAAASVVLRVDSIHTRRRLPTHIYIFIFKHISEYINTYIYIYTYININMNK